MAIHILYYQIPITKKYLFNTILKLLKEVNVIMQTEIINPFKHILKIIYTNNQIHQRP